MVSQLELIKRKAIPVLQKYHVKKAGIFGSYARGKQKRNSDVDFLIEINDQKMSLLGFIHIKHELENVLGKKVDLVEYKLLRSEIREKVAAEEVAVL